MIGRARPVGPSTAPAANDGSDLLGDIKLSNAQRPEMLSDLIKPRARFLSRRVRELLKIGAALVEYHQGSKAPGVRRPPALDRFVVARHELRRSGLATQPGAAAPSVIVGATFRGRLGDALEADAD